MSERYSKRKEAYYQYQEFSSLVQGGQIKAHWMADGSSFWYAEGEPDHTVMYRVDPGSNTKMLMFDCKKLRTALTRALGHEPPYHGIPFSDFEFLDDDTVKFGVEDKEFTCHLDDYCITALASSTEEEKSRLIPRLVSWESLTGKRAVLEVLSPDGRWFAGIKEHNVWLRSTYDGREEPLTTDGTEEYPWDLDGAQWSPDSYSLAVKKIDNRGVLRIPVVHWLKPMEEVKWKYYTKAGGLKAQVEFYVIDILSKHQTRVDTGGQKDQYIYPVGWRPDGSEVLFQAVDRHRQKLNMMAADPKTGNSRIMVIEARETFLVGHSRSLSEMITFLKDGESFIWRSERDEWAHLYLYDVDGKFIRRLTQGAFPVDRVVAVDEEDGWVYLTGQAEERPYDMHLYRVDMEGNGFERLTEGEGQHEIQFSPSKKYFIDIHSSISRPPVTELRTAAGKLVDTLSRANIEALEQMGWCPPEEFVVKAADGETDIYGALYKPFDFDPSKKYPIIDALYGGPQISVVPRTFSPPARELRGIAMAQLGFIIMKVDGRGTPGRGRAFQDVVHRNFGRHEIPDHVAALRQVAIDRPYIDTDRVGVYGRSWGGYMTARAMLTAPDVYHVGIAICPVYDLYDHMAAACETYMGLPQDNREGYEYASNLKLAQNLKGKILLVHGTSDVNATFSATMKMVEAFVRAGKPYDLLVLPGQEHGYTGVSNQYLGEAKCRYFIEHLNP